jgi:N-acetylneuraminate epimerase
MIHPAGHRSLREWISWLCLLALMPVVTVKSESLKFNWKQLPPIPDPVGLAAPFAGVSGGALIVAGGANFPDAMPWEGGQKAWHDSIFVLADAHGPWLTNFKLPHPIGYGVSVTTPAGVLCAGGSDARQHFKDVFRLNWRDGKIETTPLPPLPRPLANACGALVENTFYVAGGIETPDATNALKTFWSLDLAEPKSPWRELPPWPGPGRMLAVAGACRGSFYLCSGVSLSADAAGKPVRHYLEDAYRFTPGQGWKRIADLPRAAVAAPSPALVFQDQLLIVTGDDGELVNFEPKSAHPGFPKSMLCYQPLSDRWTNLGDTPLSRATAPVVPWKNGFVIPNGEARPGYRTPEVWSVELR